MKRTNTLICAALALLITCSGSYGNDESARRRPNHTPPGGPREDMPFLRSELGLEPEQIKSITAMINENREKMAELRERQQAAAAAVKTLMAQDWPDEDAMIQALNNHAAMNAEIILMRIRARNEIKKMLTPQQLERWNDLRAQMKNRMKERMKQRFPGDENRAGRRWEGQGRLNPWRRQGQGEHAPERQPAP